MGVPGLAPYISNKFGKKRFFKSRNISELRGKIDVLGIDGNAMIHPFAQKVFLYGKHSEDFSRRGKYPSSLEEGWIKVYHLFYLEIIRLIELIKPKEIFLAIDGVAPVAKQIQQRTRRFASANHREKEQIFDGNCISPGTEFMHLLSQYFHRRFQKDFSDVEKLGVEKVMFSSATEPGEGEHKIVEYFRQLSKEDPDKSGCFYGPDADLIMLSLACPLEKVYLVREEQFPKDINNPEFEIYDIVEIRKEFSFVLEVRNRLDSDVIRDFVLIGFLVGNDFLPRIAMFDTLKKGLDKMILEYSKLSKKNDFIPITNRKGIDLDGFYNFLFSIAKDESRFLLNQIGNDRLVRNFTLEDCLRETIPASINWEKYRSKYYEKAGGIAHAQHMCVDYLTTLQWIFEYYTKGLPSWKWYYPWHYPPLMRDLVDCLEEIQKIPKPKKSQPLAPFQQLMLILPRKSWDLIPKHLHPVLEKLAKSGAFPDTFDYDCEGKGLDYERNIKYHECIALLPFPDQVLFRDKYLKCKKPERRFHRNEFSGTKIFVKTDKVVTTMEEEKHQDLLEKKKKKPSSACDKPGCSGAGTFIEDVCPGSDTEDIAGESHHCCVCGELWWDEKAEVCEECGNYFCPSHWQYGFVFESGCDNSLGADEGVCPRCFFSTLEKWENKPDCKRKRYYCEKEDCELCPENIKRASLWEKSGIKIDERLDIQKKNKKQETRNKRLLRRKSIDLEDLSMTEKVQ